MKDNLEEAAYLSALPCLPESLAFQNKAGAVALENRLVLNDPRNLNRLRGKEMPNVRGRDER